MRRRPFDDAHSSSFASFASSFARANAFARASSRDESNALGAFGRRTRSLSARSRPNALGLSVAKRPKASFVMARARVTTDEGGENEHDIVPEGWRACPSIGDVVAKWFLPAKTPLDARRTRALGNDGRWTPSDAMAYARQIGREIACVIDLTNTSKYYDASEFEKEGVRVVKIRCAGRAGAPEAREVSEFVYVAQRCLAEIASDVKWVERARNGVKPVILVHCTHGFNRTGAMLVHYCQRAHAWPELNKWVSEFATARPPGIYKAEYLKSLFDYYLERRFSTTKDPGVPSWKSDRLSDAPPLSDDKVPEGDLFDPKTNASYKKTLAHSRAPIPGTRRASQRALEVAASDGTATPMHHEDVIGEDVFEEQAYELQKLCVWACFPDNADSRVSFPGSQPVSLSRDNMSLLKREPYSVTWKADGTRYMLMLMRDGAYLIDRKFSVRRVQMRFPLPHKKFGTAVHHGTLMDGEMVVDTDPATKKQVRRFLAYDLMAVNGERVSQRPFLERLTIVRDFVVEPRKAFFAQTGPSGAYAAQNEPFSVRTKEFHPLQFARSIIEKFIPALSHESDGLIFQPSNAPYVPQTFESLLKWKFPELNSVDFLLRVVRGSGLLFVGDKGGQYVRLEDDFVSRTEPLESLDGKIVECSWDWTDKTWVFMRTRADKDTPNFITVYQKTWKSIQDNITAHDILTFVEGTVAAAEEK